MYRSPRYIHALKGQVRLCRSENICLLLYKLVSYPYDPIHYLVHHNVNRWTLSYKFHQNKRDRVRYQ